MFFSSTDQVMNVYTGAGAAIELIGDGISKPYLGEVTSFDRGEKYITCTIDRAVRVICLNPDFYQAELRRCSQDKIIGGALAVGGALTAFKGVTLLLPDPLKGGILTISALSTVCFGIYQAIQAVQVTRELSSHETKLIDLVSAQRKKGDDFEFIFKNRLKGSVFHPGEVQLSWHHAVKRHLSSFRDVDLMAEDIDDFFDRCPLDAERRKYAEGEFRQENIRRRLFSCYDEALGRYNKINDLADRKKNLPADGSKYKMSCRKDEREVRMEIENERRRSVQKLKGCIEKIIRAYFNPDSRGLYGRKNRFLFSLKKIKEQIGGNFSSYYTKTNPQIDRIYSSEAVPVVTLVVEGSQSDLPVAVRCREGNFSPYCSSGEVTPSGGDKLPYCSDFPLYQREGNSEFPLDSAPSAPPLSCMMPPQSLKLG